MDVFAILADQHRQAKLLLDELAAGEDLSRRARSELLIELQALMLLHGLAEETALYPALSRDAQTRDRVEAAERQNVEIEHDLTCLARERDEDRWREALEALRAKLEDHAEAEETLVFPLARRMLDAASLRELGAALGAPRSADLKAPA